MAAQTGEKLSAPTHKQATQGASGSQREVALAGSGVNPIPHYILACFDSGGTRHYWVDVQPVITNAPTPTGGATYTTSTLTVLGRV